MAGLSEPPAQMNLIINHGRYILEGPITLCNLSHSFVVTQVASKIARCKMPCDHKFRQHFCWKKHLIESGSTFCNDCCNAFSSHCTATV